MRPRFLRIESEPYVTFAGRSFIPAIDVYDLKEKREYFLIISAQSISVPIKEWMDQNHGKISHLEFWINKKTAEKKSKYEIEPAP